MKTCPYCAEQIQDEAIKCKHCGEQIKDQVKKSLWRYNPWTDPDVGKTDKILNWVYLIGTLLLPWTAIIWLISIWVVRGKYLSVRYKKFMTFGLIAGFIGALMCWSDAHQGWNNAGQWFQQQ